MFRSRMKNDFEHMFYQVRSINQQWQDNNCSWALLQQKPE